MELSKEGEEELKSPEAKEKEQEKVSGKVEEDYTGKYVCFRYPPALMYMKVEKQEYIPGDYGTSFYSTSRLMVYLNNETGEIETIQIDYASNPIKGRSSTGIFFDYVELGDVEIEELSEEDFKAVYKKYLDKIRDQINI